MNVYTEVFFENPQQADVLFKRMVSVIELEISSYCNRRCGFCPNSFIDRIEKRTFMDDALFHGILAQLDALKWDGALSFHRYNEPLADRAYLLRRMEECRAMAPTAKVHLYTNGDYLDTDYLAEIYDRGCRNLIYTVYLQEGKPWDDQAAVAAMIERLKRLGLTSGEWVASRPGCHVAKVAYRDVSFTMRSVNYFTPLREDRALASNRGGSLDINTEYVRISPCMKPFAEMQIEVDGTLMPCCECRSDYEPHRAYAMGKLKPGDSLVAAWAGKTYVDWRRSLFSFGEKPAPCNNCTVAQLPDTPELRENVEKLRRHVGIA